MNIVLNPSNIEDYKTFLKIKQLPSFTVRGRLCSFPDEYANLIGVKASPRMVNWEPSRFLFDYQKAITHMSVEKRKFAVFADCGLGKTLMQLEFAQGQCKPWRVKAKDS